MPEKSKGKSTRAGQTRQTSKSPNVETESGGATLDAAGQGQAPQQHHIETHDAAWWHIHGQIIDVMGRLPYDALVDWQRELGAVEKRRQQGCEAGESERESSPYPWNPLDSFHIFAPDSVVPDMKGPSDIPDACWEAVKMLLDKGYVLGWCIADYYEYGVDIAAAVTKRVPYHVILEHARDDQMLFIQRA